jgi:hypothetical protein
MLSTTNMKLHHKPIFSLSFHVPMSVYVGVEVETNLQAFVNSELAGGEW